MYDFYQRGVHSYEDVREYLSSWLVKLGEDKQVPIMFNGKLHFQEASFRRAFASHLVLLDPEEQTYIFVVVAEDIGEQMMPITAYENTYDAMIDSAARYYCKLWQIHD
jgi:hypothetical protein